MTPDYFSPLEGWRAFALTQGNGVLRSVVQKVPWPSVESGEACCLDPGLGFGGHRHGADEPCPKERCTCGFYAFKTREQAEYEGDRSLVLARVALWGRVVIHERGYRAARMRVEELFIPQGLDTAVASLMDRYPVPLHVVEAPPWTSAYLNAPSTLNRSQYLQSFLHQYQTPISPALIPYQPLHQNVPPTVSSQWGWMAVPDGALTPPVSGPVAASFLRTLTDADVRRLLDLMKQRQQP